MKSPLKLLLAGASLSLLMPTTSFAQEQAAFEIEEIVVTGRKREESLQEVPISISVLSQQFLQDTGIVDQRDLFELVPGIQYDQTLDRLAATPSVRGIQSSETATNRTKVTSFLDGMPIIGAVGSIVIGGNRQVEVYRGPQSAAFGRSTFGGAINYISPDPGEEFEGAVNVDINDYGRQILSGFIGGPISDKVGFLVGVSTEDSSAPNEFIATDGGENGSRSGDSISAKLVFTPTDATEIELAFSHVETADAAPAAYFLSQEARDACYDGTNNVGMGVSPWGTGVIDCDWSQGPQIVSQSNRVPALVAAGVTDPNILFLAEMESITPDRNGSFDERDRVTIQIDHSLDNGQLIQFSGFVGDEEYIRETDTSRSLAAIDIGINPMSGLYAVNTGMGATVGVIMSDPTEISEEYAEVRWVSPSDQRLRWLGGASYYSSEFLTSLYFGGYTAVLQGAEAIARYDALTGTPAALSVGIPSPLLGEDTENVGVFVNLTYDITDQLTVTAEGRYQVDNVSATDAATGFTIERETKAFLPRLSFNYNLSDSTSLYGQFAKGNNPAGINASFTNQNYIDTLDNGIPDGLDADGDGNPASRYVDYNSEDLIAFDEEELLQIEFGMKGAALDNRLQYAVAIFAQQWDNEAQTVNLNWADPLSDLNFDFSGTRLAINNGDKETKGIEFEGTYFVNDSFNIRGTFAYTDAEYAEFCDIANAANSGLATDPSKFETHPVYGSNCYQLEGNTVNNVSPVSGSISPSYTTELNNGMSLNLRGDIRYEGKQYYDVFNVAEQSAVTTMNLSAGIRADSWSATLYVNNLTDEDTPTRLQGGTDYSINAATDTTGLGNRNYLITPRNPRTIGLRASYNF